MKHETGKSNNNRRQPNCRPDGRRNRVLLNIGQPNQSGRAKAQKRQENLSPRDPGHTHVVEKQHDCVDAGAGRKQSWPKTIKPKMKNRTHYNKAIRLLGIYRVNSNPYFHAWAYDGGLWPDGRKRIVARCTKETELAKARKAAAKFVLELNRKNP